MGYLFTTLINLSFSFSSTVLLFVSIMKSSPKIFILCDKNAALSFTLWVHNKLYLKISKNSIDKIRYYLNGGLIVGFTM